MKMMGKCFLIVLSLAVSGGDARAQYGGMFPPLTPGFWGLGSYGYSPWINPWYGYSGYYGAGWGGGYDGDAYAVNYGGSGMAGCCTDGCNSCATGCSSGCADGSCAPSSSGGSLKPAADENFRSRSDENRDSRDRNLDSDRYERERDDRLRRDRSDDSDSLDSRTRPDSRATDPLDRNIRDNTDSERYRRTPETEPGRDLNSRDEDNREPRTWESRDRAPADSLDEPARSQPAEPAAGTETDDFPAIDPVNSQSVRKPPMSDPLGGGSSTDSSSSTDSPDADADKILTPEANESEGDSLGTPADVRDFLPPIDTDTDPASPTSESETSGSGLNDLDSEKRDLEKTDSEKAGNNENENSDGVSPAVTKSAATQRTARGSLREVVPASRLAGRRLNSAPARITSTSTSTSKPSGRSSIRWISLPSKTDVRIQL
jgi:hypothetical protein